VVAAGEWLVVRVLGREAVVRANGAVGATVDPPRHRHAAPAEHPLELSVGVRFADPRNRVCEDRKPRQDHQ